MTVKIIFMGWVFNDTYTISLHLTPINKSIAYTIFWRRKDYFHVQIKIAKESLSAFRKVRINYDGESWESNLGAYKWKSEIPLIHDDDNQVEITLQDHKLVICELPGNSRARFDIQFPFNVMPLIEQVDFEGSQKSDIIKSWDTHRR